MTFPNEKIFQEAKILLESEIGEILEDQLIRFYSFPYDFKDDDTAPFGKMGTGQKIQYQMNIFQYDGIAVIFCNNSFWKIMTQFEFKIMNKKALFDAKS